jgi:hypothetical protein
MKAIRQQIASMEFDGYFIPVLLLPAAETR